jgi:hypothetical protein
MKKIILSICIISSLSSCTVSKPIYYYSETYDKAYYESIKNPGAETSAAYIDALRDMISKTEKKKSLNIGPGIYAEYGYHFLQKGDVETAKIYFDKEQSKFPESQVIINFLENSNE